MRKILNLITLVFACIILQCCCGPYMSSYEPVSKSKTISPFLVTEFTKAKRYKGDIESGFQKKDTTMSIGKNSISLYEPINIGILDLLGITSPNNNWDKHNTELKEWFHAMGIPLKECEKGWIFIQK